MNTKHTPAKTANQILYEYSIDIMKMGDEFNFQLLHAMERYAEQYSKEQNAELLEALKELVLVAKTFEILPSKWVDPLIKAENLLNKANN